MAPRALACIWLIGVLGRRNSLVQAHIIVGSARRSSWNPSWTGANHGPGHCPLVAIKDGKRIADIRIIRHLYLLKYVNGYLHSYSFLMWMLKRMYPYPICKTGSGSGFLNFTPLRISVTLSHPYPSQIFQPPAVPPAVLAHSRRRRCAIRGFSR